MVPFIVKPRLRLACDCLSVGLLILITGCGKGNRAEKNAEVSGKVLFQGKPLPGGRLSFVNVNGGYATTGVIDESGNYTIKAPVGDVKISVDNSMLKTSRFGGGPPQKMHHPRPPGAEAEEQPLKGQYVEIPSQYKDPGASGLTYTVKSGPQTHDIELSNSPTGAPAR